MCVQVCDSGPQSVCVQVCDSGPPFVCVQVCDSGPQFVCVQVCDSGPPFVCVQVYEAAHNLCVFRYVIAAQQLVSQARGRFTGQGWKKAGGEPASFDDISAFVVPLKGYMDHWQRLGSLENTIEATIRS